MTLGGLEGSHIRRGSIPELQEAPPELQNLAGWLHLQLPVVAEVGKNLNSGWRSATLEVALEAFAQDLTVHADD